MEDFLVMRVEKLDLTSLSKELEAEQCQNRRQRACGAAECSALAKGAIS